MRGDLEAIKITEQTFFSMRACLFLREKKKSFLKPLAGATQTKSL